MNGTNIITVFEDLGKVIQEIIQAKDADILHLQYRVADLEAKLKKAETSKI
jgi:hypothetical protein